MLLRAGLVSLALLLASRLLGLLRESVQAAALGSGALADATILMLTLPDLMTGILASGALGYVLLPLWARQGAAAQRQGLQQLGRWLLLGGGFIALALLGVPGWVGLALAPGLGDTAQPLLHAAVRWSALALPLALLAALWTTRLQHLRDFTGLYGANLVVNGVLVTALLLVAVSPTTLHNQEAEPLFDLGVGLLLAMGLRLLWLRWRLRADQQQDAPVAPQGQLRANDERWPLPSVWLWALASAGLPLALPLLARSLASSGGEGALTTFNYAWKLVELPLVLAIQLVATLAFPGIARAFASGPAAGTHTARRDALRQAFVLAWVLACAAAAALAGMAPALANLLFGWGRMPPESVEQIARWARIGAWSLLPQALLAVLLTLTASTGRLRSAVGVYLGALALLAALAWVMPDRDGAGVMLAVNAALGVAAVALLLSERAFVRGALVARDLLPAAAAALCLATVGAQWTGTSRLGGLALALLIAATVMAVAWLASPGLRRAVRR